MQNIRSNFLIIKVVLMFLKKVEGPYLSAIYIRKSLIISIIRRIFW